MEECCQLCIQSVRYSSNIVVFVDVSNIVFSDDSISSDAELEYSCVYLPDVWSLIDQKALSVDLVNAANCSESLASALAVIKEEPEKVTESNSSTNDKLNSLNENVQDTSSNTSTIVDSSEQPVDNISDPKVLSAGDCVSDSSAIQLSTEGEATLQHSSPSDVPLGAETSSEEMQDTLATNDAESKSVPQTSSTLKEKMDLLNRISELKVTELKAELDDREVKYPRTAKKAELVAKLKETLGHEIDAEDAVSDAVKGDWWAQKILKEESKESTKASPEAVVELVFTAMTDGEPMSVDTSSEEPAASGADVFVDVPGKMPLRIIVHSNAKYLEKVLAEKRVHNNNDAEKSVPPKKPRTEDSVKVCSEFEKFLLTDQ